MFNYDNIKIKFSENNYKLLEPVGNSYFCRILNSDDLTVKVATKIIEEAGSCPLFFEKRIQGDLLFTITPYQCSEILTIEVYTERRLKVKDLSKLEVTLKANKLWNLIASTVSQFQPEKLLIVKGHNLGNSLAYQQKSFQDSELAPDVSNFIEQAPEKGEVLDLGCGFGANSFPFLKKGWKVVGIDISSTLLKEFKKSAGSYIEDKQLELIEEDITESEMKENHYDLIICQNTIPYVKAEKVQSLMKKIFNSLKNNGKLIGSILIDSPELGKSTKQILEKMGAHLYKGGEQIGPALLNYTGFSIEKCTIERATKFHPSVCEFIGIKK